MDFRGTGNTQLAVEGEKGRESEKQPVCIIYKYSQGPQRLQTVRTEEAALSQHRETRTSAASCEFHESLKCRNLKEDVALR